MIRSGRFGLIKALVTVRKRFAVFAMLWLVLPSAWAQCPFGMVMCADAGAVGAMLRECNVYLTTGSFYNVCSTTSSNAQDCGKSTAVKKAAKGVNTNGLRALANTGLTTMPFCQWQCDCGAGPETFRIDGGDGLPVELMDFSIEESADR